MDVRPLLTIEALPADLFGNAVVFLRLDVAVAFATASPALISLAAHTIEPWQTAEAFLWFEWSLDSPQQVALLQARDAFLVEVAQYDETPWKFSVAVSSVATEADVGVVARLQKLTELSLSSCEVSDIGFAKFRGGFGSLTTLEFRDMLSSTLNDRVLQTVASSIPTLQHFVAEPSMTDLDEITDAGILGFVQVLPELQSLRLNSAVQITDDAVASVAKHCPGMTELDLYGATRLTDRACVIIANSMPLLKVLGLGNCPGIGNGGVKHVAASQSHLTSLTFTACRNITDEAIEMVAVGCPLLTTLYLDGCDEVTNVALRHIAASLKRLSRLGLSFTRITNAGVSVLVNGCPALHWIDMRYCRSVNDDVIACLAQLPERSSLRLTGSGISSDARKQLQKMRNDLTFV